MIFKRLLLPRERERARERERERKGGLEGERGGREGETFLGDRGK
jgi:hypothetical protein